VSLTEALLNSLDGDATVREARAGRNWIAVWSWHCGLASTLGSSDDATIIDVAGLAGRSARDLARLALSDVPLDAALGMAAVNSLVEIDESRCEERNGRDVLLEWSAGKSVALVGHFPFVPELREVARELSVLELRPRPGDLPSTEAAQRIPEAGVVAITGTAFVNHTIEPLLSYCRPDALVIIIGPTSPLSPLLFDYGVDIISGARVSDPPLVLRQVAEGVDFRHMRGIRRLTLRRPGI
jgi:uncharacterized protein (DUF4213/DUF364 family)